MGNVPAVRALLLTVCLASGLAADDGNRLRMMGGGRPVPALWATPPVLGTGLTVNLEGAAPGSVALVGLSASQGPTTIPGYGTFNLGADLAVVFQGRVDTRGWLSFSLPLPAGASLAGRTAYWQAAVLDPLVPGRVAVSMPLTTRLRHGRYMVANEGLTPGPGFPGVPGTALFGDAATQQQAAVATHFFPHKVVLQADGRRAYVVSRFENPGNVLVIDPVATRILRTLTVGPFPRDLAVSADDRQLFVLNGSASTEPGSVDVFRTGDLKRVGRYGVKYGAAKVIAAGARYALVLAPLADAYVVDTAQGAVQGPIRAAVGSDTMVFDAGYPRAGGALAYVLAGQPKPLFPIPPGPKPGHLIALDVARARLAGSAQVGTHPLVLDEVLLRGGPAFVAVNLASRDATVVDCATLRVLRTLRLLPRNPAFMAGIPATARFGVVVPGLSALQSPPNGVPGSLEILDAETGQSVRRIQLGPDVQTSVAAATVAGRSTVYVVNRFAGTLDRYDPVTGARRGASVSGKNPVFVDVR